MRLDQWLWAVRLYRTRTLATTSIRDGLVTVNGKAPKPSHEIRPGQTVAARTGDLTRTYLVLGSPPSRVGAPKVAEFATDQTPPEEFVRVQELSKAHAYRPRGEGRPTKRDRRQMERWSGDT